MLASALADHEFMARQLRPAIAQCGAAGDEASADFLTGLLHQHEHTAWMLRVHLAD
jgi:starvation-inducible DNA-binding protein